jgi:hypothetical protein
LRASRCRAFVIHARDDRDVSFHCAEEIVSEVSAAELRAFDGLGHRNILFAPQVARAVTAYLAPPIRVQEVSREPSILPIPQMPPSEPQAPIHYHG